MKKRGLALAVVSAMLVATLGACGAGTTKTAGDSTAAQSQDSGSKQAENTERWFYSKKAVTIYLSIILFLKLIHS